MMGKMIGAVILLCILSLTGCTMVSPSDDETAGPIVSESETQEGHEPEEVPAAPASDDGEASQLPSNLPANVATPSDINGEGGYLLLGEVAEEDIALYCDNSEERNQAYIRYGEHFQAFDQKAWIDPTILPELDWEDWDGDGSMDLVVQYLRHEGTFFDGKTTSPGIVYEEVVYQWDGTRWTDIHFYSGGALARIEE